MSPRLHRVLSDEQLGGRLALGEAAAFDELYRRYVHRLAAYGTHLLGDAASGDDVAQVALMRAYQALRSGRPPSAFRPWLYRIAHNAAIDVVRSRQELPTSLVPERADHPRDSDEAGALLTAIAALPERQRHVYVLRELHGMRIDEVAAELGLTGQQVEQSLFAARNRLAEQLVFGERLGCTTVRRLAAGPLDLRERRALKTHLRSCPACRSELGARGIALTVVPAPSEWLRGLLALLGSGGAPVAAKVGAMVATATVAAGVPLVADQHQVPPHGHPARHAPVRRAHSKVVPVPVSDTPAAPVLAVHVPAATTVERHDGERQSTDTPASSDGVSDGGGENSAAAPTTGTIDGGGGGDTTQSVDGGGTTDRSSTTPLTTTTAVTSDGMDGSGG